MTCYFKEYDMVTWHDLELRNKPVRTRFLHKKNGKIVESYISEWSSTRQLVKLSDNAWYSVYDIEVLDYLSTPHIDYIPNLHYGKPIPNPWTTVIPMPYHAEGISNITPVMFDPVYCGDPGDVLRSSSTTSQVLS